LKDRAAVTGKSSPEKRDRPWWWTWANTGRWSFAQPDFPRFPDQGDAEVAGKTNESGQGRFGGESNRHLLPRPAKNSPAPLRGDLVNKLGEAVVQVRTPAGWVRGSS